MNKQLAAHDRQLQALELRKQGLDFRAIASELGYAGPSGPYKAVAVALRETLREPADQVRALELSRLDAMLQAIWTTAIEGDLKAIATVLQLMDRRARYLGLDAAVKVDVEQTIRVLAEQYGFDPSEVLAEAGEILRESRR